jgi:adenylyltransferase/sulfurtransferase
MLSTEERKKYVRQIMIPGVGIQGQEKIRNASIAIVGIGGLGCPVLQYLASAGVGKIGIIDFDTVNLSNLHRQILFGNNDVGLKKTEVAKAKIGTMHPEVEIKIHDEMLDEKNAVTIFRDYDMVVDGCDNFLTRYIVNDACVKLGKPLVYGSILGYEGQLAVFNLRGSKNLRDIFPEPPNPDEVPDCSENGVLATVPGIVGNLMANECLKVILDKQPLQNKFLVMNVLDMKTTILNF